MAIEDRQELYGYLLSIMPVARTPLSKEGARALDSYTKDIRCAVERLTPWKGSLRHLRERLSAGKVVVTLDSPLEANLEIFQDEEIQVIGR